MSSRPPRRSAIADPGSGSGQAEPIGADRELALLHIPPHVREAFAALFAIDAAMADVVARATDPDLARIKLAWWRERLQALDAEPAPAEPRLQAVAAKLLSEGISGEAVAELEPGWATLLDEQVDAQLVAVRGATLFRLGGRLLGSEDERLADAGSLYALASVGRRGVPELFAAANQHVARLRGHRFDRSLRPLTMLARAAARDIDRQEPEGSRGRILAMLAHRWSGRVS